MLSTDQFNPDRFLVRSIGVVNALHTSSLCHSRHVISSVMYRFHITLWINRFQPPLAVRLRCLAMEAKLYLHLARTLVVIAGLISGVSMYCMWSQTSFFDKVLMFVIFSLMLVICLMISALHEAISRQYYWIDSWEDWWNCYWPDEARVDLMPDNVPVDPWQRHMVELEW